MYNGRLQSVRSSVKATLAWSLLCLAGILHAQTDVDMHSLLVPTDITDESESALIKLPFGLHRIEPESANAERMIIAIHDLNSIGFEWVHPLQLMDDELTDSYFLRWNPSECPSASIEALNEKLTSLLDSDETVKKVTLVGHGLGGVYLSQFTREWKSLVPLDVHVVAAPLRGNIGVFQEEDCGEILPKRLPPTIRFFQWRIALAQSEFFKEQKEDPQEIELQGSLVISLPEIFAGDPVDSTRALEIVAARIQSEHLEATEHTAPSESKP